VPDQKPLVGLALAGGGARGMAHLGIIDYFNEKNYEVAAVAGCSIGAIVGAQLALGKDVEEMAEMTRTFKFRSLIKLTWPRLGFSKLSKMQAYFQNLYGDATFEDTKIPLRIVASDLDSKEEVVFDSGPIWEAVLASAAIPVIFEPHEWQGRRLSDGGLARLNPATCLTNLKLDAIVGSDIGLTRMRTGPVKGIGDCFKQCLEIFIQGQRDQSEAVAALTLHPEVLTEPFLNFSRLDKLRRLGRECCEKEAEALATIFNQESVTS
jgi:NTE family protein